MQKNQFEQIFVNALTSFPGIYNKLSRLYLRLYFLLAVGGGTKTKAELHPNVTLLRPEHWAGIKDQAHFKRERFFGYYDKSPWSFSDSGFLFHEIAEAKPYVKIVVYDKAGIRYDIGETKTWNFQQGAMAQWVPDRRDRVAYNAIKNKKLVCETIDPYTRQQTKIDCPVQVLHPNGREGLTLNYKRLHQYRPEYGYRPDVVNFFSNQKEANDGIWHFQLDTGKSTLVLSLKRLVMFQPKPSMKGANHWVNHLMYSPSGERFLFLHRWKIKSRVFSRLYVSDRSWDPEILMDDDVVSHFCWKDDDTILVWGFKASKGYHYYLINVTNKRCRAIGEKTLSCFGDGHPSFSPDKKWILTDTYPDRKRLRHLLLYQPDTDRLIRVGSFFSPWKFDGMIRCDLHPRWNHDGTMISFDSSHEGYRNTFLLDVTRLLNSQ